MNEQQVQMLRELAISYINGWLKDVPFKVEHKVTNEPANVKVIIEVSKEQMDEMIKAGVKTDIVL